MAAPVAVLGAGSWGTALGLQLARNGHPVRLWAHRAEHAATMTAERVNRRYLPDSPFPDNLQATTELSTALKGAGLVLVVVPSHAFGAILRELAGQPRRPRLLAWATKGLEHGSGRFLHDVAADCLGTDLPPAMVSGPSFARELARGLPTAVTVASPDRLCASAVAEHLHGGCLRVYTSADLVGVELGGAVKNVLAIAAGISDGLGFGANARAALITRGLAEMVRLGEAVGGQRETFMGLAGVGDLILTCTDDQSRNRRFGLALGQGRPAVDAEAAIGQVVEGAATARAIAQLAAGANVELPICTAVLGVLDGRLSARAAVEALLARERKAED